MIGRRTFAEVAVAGLAVSALGLSTRVRAASSSARVVIVGGGFAGATAARYIRLLSNQSIDVELVEQNTSFVSCPMSNLVVGGEWTLPRITFTYDSLRQKHGLKVTHDEAVSVDTGRKFVQLKGGSTIGYDKLILAPGIELMFETIDGLARARAKGQILQAWKAGGETVALFKQIKAMRNGGVFAISIPEAPYRCPPGPYERASLVAAYLKEKKPRSKVLIFDANQDVVSKGALFKKAWNELYPDMIEYRPQHRVIGVDAKTMTAKLDFHEDVKADVLNVLPSMRAGALAVQSGLANSNGRWCQVNFLNFESSVTRDIHVIGDSVQDAARMPKSAHMANSQAKVAAAAVVAELIGAEINSNPVLNNVCYSHLDRDAAIHVASVHRYDAAKQTFLPVEGAGGLSEARSAAEARYALAWARNIWADTLG